MLQICQTEPAVRHAVLAVSSLHEGLGAGTIIPFTDGRLTQSTQSFALQQYNKAIARLLDQMNNPLTKPLASLLTCVLFVCIEYMQGKEKESLIHLEQGRQLLARLNQRSSDPEMECIVRHIVPLYTRLSLTSFLFGGSPVPIPDALKPQREIPDTFDTIDNMRHCMHEFMEQAFRFTQRARPAKNSSDSIPRETMRLLEVEQDRLLARHAKLNVAFSLFRASTAKPMQTHLSALLVLQMYLHAQHIWISTALSSSEVVYDDFLSSFAAIVPLAAAYLDQEHPPAFPPQRTMPLAEPSHYFLGAKQLSVAYTSNFTFETHIIPPLYYVATKCRHPLIRRSALELLRKNPFRRENLWRASVMGALAGHIVSLEERWAQAQAFSAVASSVSNAGDVSLSGTNHSTPSGQMKLPHAQAHHDAPGGDFGLYSMSAEAESKLAVPLVEPPVDPSLLMDVEASSLLSHAPSLAASVEDGYSPGSMAEPGIAFLSPPSQHTWVWQQQQQQQRYQQLPQSSSNLTYTSSAPYESLRAQGHYLGSLPEHHQQAGSSMTDYSSHSSSSDISSVEVEEQHRYQMTLARSHAAPPPPPPQQHMTAQQRRGPQYHNYHHDDLGGPVPSNLVTEAPFGLPEELRVHDAIIGPEREDGSWVAVFRKLHGVDAGWDVQHDWVSTM